MGDKIEVGDLKNVQGLAVGEGATAEIHHHYPSPAPTPANTRNRKNYLNALKTTWIDGFLHQSLHSEVIKLTMTEVDGDLLARDARQRSWGMVKQQAGKVDEQIPLDKSVGEIFEESGCGLLILGDPGSGKTITVLQLAEQLMNAAASPDQLMPVVLNLSSWGQTQPPLIEWLVEEIFVQYSVGRELARTWIEKNQFIYLLDGLDEVAADARDACIAAINAFRANRAGVVEMAVCSRTNDYDQLTARLNLTAAIQIQPLTDEQIESYLSSDKLEMKAVRDRLKTDVELKALTRSPLMLNVMTLAYNGIAEADLRTAGNVEAHRRHLFDAYIDKMFAHRPLPADNGYSEAEARHWLTEVAHGLNSHGMSELYLEKLQPDWLPDGKPRRRYTTFYGLIGRLIFGLAGGLVGSLIGGLIGVMIDGLNSGLILGLVGGLVGGLIGELIGGLVSRLRKDKSQIKSVEELHWLFSPLHVLFKAIKDGLNIGASIGLRIGWSVGLISGLIIGLPFGLIVGLISGLIVGIIIGTTGGLNSGLNACFEKRETRQKMSPNQGIRSSRYNTWRMSLLSFLILSGMGTVISLGLCIVMPLYAPILFPTITGIFAYMGLLNGFYEYGGNTIIKHYTLRWVMARQGILPYPFWDKKLITYLDAMVDRLLLRRKGNGYMFIHRTLLEHFAAKHE